MSLPRLMYAASERCADLLYATGVFVPDAFLWAATGDRCFVVVSPLEYSHLRNGVRPGVEVLSFAQARDRFGAATAEPEVLIAALAKHFAAGRWEVPADFPLGLARRLAELGVDLVPATGAFFPERQYKRPDEVAAITAGVRLAEAGLARGIEVLGAARIAGDRLEWEGKTLTAERLRGEIDAAIVRHGGLPAHTIVAPGACGAEPHNEGSGPILPHQPLVLDIFPRVAASGYFGDLTRTVVKGRAPAIVRRAHAAVRAARDQAKDMLHAGVDGPTVHQALVDALANAGFPTALDADPPVGFIHGTGHGLGLEVHEAPRLSSRPGTLEAGHVVTVEPGVYDPAWGGMRLEDVVVITAGGCDCLTTAADTLEID